MICYKDRTYCSNPACDNKCGKKFTEEDRINAIKWWGSEDFPLAMSDFCGRIQSDSDPTYTQLIQD